MLCLGTYIYSQDWHALKYEHLPQEVHRSAMQSENPDRTSRPPEKIPRSRNPDSDRSRSQSRSGAKPSSLRGTNGENRSGGSEQEQSMNGGHSDNSDKSSPAYKTLADQTKETQKALESFLGVLAQRKTVLENDRDFKEIKKIPISLAKYVSSKPKAIDRISEELKLWQEEINATSTKLNELTAKMETDKVNRIKVIKAAFKELENEK